MVLAEGREHVADVVEEAMVGSVDEHSSFGDTREGIENVGGSVQCDDCLARSGSTLYDGDTAVG